MTRDDIATNGRIADPKDSFEEDLDQPFLKDDSIDSDELSHLPRSQPQIHTTRPPIARQSSLSQPRPPGTPRTTNRVRFDVEDGANTHLRRSEDWVDDEDFLHSPGQDAPLLTDITPPLDSPFLSDAFQPEDHLPNARPKSGMRSAIMNMANSIIGAGEFTR